MPSYIERSECENAELKTAQKAVAALKRREEKLLNFLAALSFVRAKDWTDTFDMVSTRSKPCDCGSNAPVIITQQIDNPDKWIAQCRGCFVRTIDADNPVHAVKLWNAGKITEESRMLKTPLKPKEVSINGLIALCDAITTDAIKDLVACEAHDMLDSKLADEARAWIRNKKTIASIERGEWRDTIRGEGVTRVKDCIELQ